jgi:hypothetical protein
MQEENSDLEDTSVTEADNGTAQHVEVQIEENEARSPISPVPDEAAAVVTPSLADGAATVEPPRLGRHDAHYEKPGEESDWLPVSLSLWFMALLISWDVLMILALLTRTVISTLQNGIPTVQNASIIHSLTSRASAASSAYALLWTSLPSLIVSVYNLTRGLSVTAIALRQPYVTLWRKPKGASARKTIFLDYQYQGGILGACLMRRNKHWSILAATVLTFITSIAIVPLSAHVLEVRQTSLNSTVQIQYDSTFNGTVGPDIFDILGALDVASAVVVYQASPPPWMDKLRGYQSFTMPHAPNNASVTVETVAYSALLDCNIITPEEWVIDSSGQATSVAFNDRGCAVTQDVNTVHLATILFSSYSVQTCGIAAQFSRFGLLAASYSNGSQSVPTALHVVSCEPSYWQINGSLTLSLNLDGNLAVSSFRNSSPWDLSRPGFWENFEGELVEYAVIDTSGFITGDEFGRMVYSYARANNPENIFDPDTLKAGLENAFPAAYAAALPAAFSPAPQTSLLATLTTPVYRLFIITAIAAIIMCFLVFNLLCNMWILFRSRRYGSILAEEPRGLLATTALAYDSRPDAQHPGVYSAIERFKAHYPAERAVRNKMEKDRGLDKMVCYFDRETGTIRLRNFPGGDDAMTTSANVARRGAGSP